MSTKEEILREQTFKEEGFEVERRVFYTLIDEDSRWTQHRNAKLTALLIHHLRKKNLITDDEIDDFLFDCVR